MITILLLLGVLSVLAIGTLVYQAFHAPVGREDGEGFHYAVQPAPVRVARETYTRSDGHEAAAHVATQHFPAV